MRPMTKVFRRLFRDRIIALAIFTALGAAVITTDAVGAVESSVITALLVHSGDMKGFKLGTPRVFHTAGGLKDASGEALAKPEVRRYEAEGFVEAAVVRIFDRSESAAKGASAVFKFESPAGAEEDLTVRLKQRPDRESLRRKGLSPYFKVKRVTVKGVPGAVLVAYVTNGKAANFGIEAGIAEALVVEEGCLVSVGLFRPASQDVIKPTISGIKAIASRTLGACS